MLLSLGALTGGLLSSSCCVIQLVLNYTSIGCAGFSALTPYKHVFRAITGASKSNSGSSSSGSQLRANRQQESSHMLAGNVLQQQLRCKLLVMLGTCPPLQNQSCMHLSPSRQSHHVISTHATHPATALLHVLAAGTLGYLLLSQGLNKRTVTTLLLSLALATSQDVLAARNTGSLSSGVSGLQQLLSGWGIGARLQQQQQQQPQQQPVAASKTMLQVSNWCLQLVPAGCGSFQIAWSKEQLQQQLQ
jgi:hypothetical protein